MTVFGQTVPDARFGLLPWAKITPSNSGAGMEETGDRFGQSLTAGNFKNLGNDELAIGAPYENNIGYACVNEYVAGNFTCFLGIWGEQRTYRAGDEFSYAMTAGDFNFDGFDELAVSAPKWDGTTGTTTNMGVVLVYKGASGGLTYNQMISNAYPYIEFGKSMDAGDLNPAEDQYDDIVIGAPYHDTGGQAMAYKGRNLSTTLGWYGEIKQSPMGTSEVGDRFGWSVSISEAHTDGYVRIAVGAPYEVLGSTASAGFVFVYKWQNGTAVGEVGLSHSGSAAYDYLGGRVAWLLTGKAGGYVTRRAQLFASGSGIDIGGTSNAGAVMSYHGAWPGTFAEDETITQEFTSGFYMSN